MMKGRGRDKDEDKDKVSGQDTKFSCRLFPRDLERFQGQQYGAGAPSFKRFHEVKSDFMSNLNNF